MRYKSAWYTISNVVNLDIGRYDFDVDPWHRYFRTALRKTQTLICKQMKGLECVKMIRDFPILNPNKQPKNNTKLGEFPFSLRVTNADVPEVDDANTPFRSTWKKQNHIIRNGVKDP